MLCYFRFIVAYVVFSVNHFFDLFFDWQIYSDDVYIDKTTIKGGYVFTKRIGLLKKIIDTGLNQTEFANSININRMDLNKLISGRYNFNEEEAEKIAIALDCEISDVVNDFQQ